MRADHVEPSALSRMTKCGAQAAAALESLLAGLAASSCCLLPWSCFSLGTSGAWIGTIVRAAPSGHILITVMVVCLCVSYWLVYRSRTACVGREMCGAPVADRFTLAPLACPPFSSSWRSASTPSPPAARVVTENAKTRLLISLVLALLILSQTAFAAERTVSNMYCEACPYMVVARIGDFRPEFALGGGPIHSYDLRVTVK